MTSRPDHADNVVTRVQELEAKGKSPGQEPT
jgi:hypothetical protein